MKLIHVALFIYTVHSFDLKFEIKSFQVELVTNPRVHDLGLINMRAEENSMNLMKSTEVTKTNSTAVTMENLTNSTAVTMENLTNSTEVTMENLMEVMKANSTEVTKPILFKQSERNETAANASCRPQMPEKKKIDAVLSDMMNQLTLMFAKVNHFISSEVTKVSRKFLNADVIRRALETRFKVSHMKRKLVFDDVFNNMTKTYRSVYNSTADGVFRADESTCKEVASRQLRNLLEYSMLALRNAMRTSIAEYLKSQTISPESALGQKVNKLLATEIGQIRVNQLNMLCEKFQLCNATSLQDYGWGV